MIAPRVAAAFQEKRTDELQRLTTRAGRLSFVLTLPALPIIWFYGDWLIAFLFGEAYVTETLDAVIVLVAGQTAGLFFGSVWPLLIMTGHERQALNRLIMSCGLNLFLCLWLAPIYGAAGAALAAALSLIIWKFSFSVDIKKRLKINTNLL
jgi:O-antigen/teichoic acid export membrane protein